MARNLSTLPGLLCSTALTFTIANTAAFADESTDFAGETAAYTLDPIIVKRRDPDGEAADRATSAYVSDAELERASTGDLKDLFAGIASVSVGGAISVAQKIYVNGVDMLNLAVQVDGVSQNNRVFHHASSNAFDPGIMKSVRVDPGVAPADAGPGALAGRVVLETVDADDILEEGENFGGKSRLSYSDNGDIYQGSLSLAGRSQGFEILAYAKRATGDSYEDGNGDVVPGTRTDVKVGLLKLAYESEEGHRVELSGQQLVDKALRNRRANFGYAPWNPTTNIYDTKRTIYALRYENTQGGGMWDPSATFGISESEVASISPSETSRGVTRTYSATLQNRFHLSANDTITVGVDYRDRKSTAGGDFWADSKPFENSRNFGVFAQARLEPTDKLSVSTGLRYDWEDFDGQGFLGQGLGVADDPFNDSSSGFSGNLSFVYDVTDEFSLRAGYSSVFGGFDIADNFLFWQPWDYSGIRTSRGKNIVLGADFVRGNLRLGGEVFKTEIDDTRAIQGSTVSSYDFESRGYNLGVTYGWEGGFARLTFSDSENFVNGERASSYYMRDNGAPLGQVLALQVQQEIPAWNLLVGGGVDAALSYSHGAQDQDPGEPEPVAFEGYEVLNLFVEYTPPAAKNVTIRAEIDNVFDRQFADRATYGGDYSTLPTLQEPGRTLSLVATVKF